MLIFCNHNRGPDRIVRAFLDGEDVTNRCFALDVQSGFVGLIVRDGKQTAKQFDPLTRQWRTRRTFRRGEVAIVRANGTVTASPEYFGKLAHVLHEYVPPARTSLTYPCDPLPDPTQKRGWLLRLIERVF